MNISSTPVKRTTLKLKIVRPHGPMQSFNAALGLWEISIKTPTGWKPQNIMVPNARQKAEMGDRFEMYWTVIYQGKQIVEIKDEAGNPVDLT